MRVHDRFRVLFLVVVLVRVRDPIRNRNRVHVHALVHAQGCILCSGMSGVRHVADPDNIRGGFNGNFDGRGRGSFDGRGCHRDILVFACFECIL